MNDAAASTIVARERIANVVAALNTLIAGDMDVEAIKRALIERNDEFGEIEQLIVQLAVDLRVVVQANDTYTREIESNAAELEEKLRTIERQQLAIHDLSTPVIELWDDKYMWPAPGMRIHGSYDTANDLQCDLIGMTVGGLMAYAILKRQREAVQVAA